MRMETVVVKKRKKKELKLLEAFEELFRKQKEPITVNAFREIAYEHYKDFYSKGMIHTAIKSMVKQKIIQQVFLKEGKSPQFLFAPLSISIPYERREWETKKEKEQRYEQFISQMKEISQSEYELFMEMVKTRAADKKRIRMPLLTALKEKNEEYWRFIIIIKPYLSYLDYRHAYAIKMRLGVEENEPKSIEEIGKSMGIGYSQCSQIFNEGLYKIEKMIKEKIRMQKEHSKDEFDE